ncbi:hypothetical protein WA158_002109 [Blastocystis sp. Blastoise]
MESVVHEKYDDVTTIKDFTSFICPPDYLIKQSQKSIKQSLIASSVVRDYSDYTKGVNHVRWNPQYGHLLASCSMDSFCHIHSVFPDHGSIMTIKHEDIIKDIRWNFDGSKLLTGSKDKTVKYIDVQTGKTICSYPHKDSISSVCFHPSNPSFFLAGGETKGIVCWDIRLNKVIGSFYDVFGTVEDLAFTDKTGNTFISSADILRKNSTDRGLIAWDFNKHLKISNQIYMEGFNCTSLCVHPTMNIFAAQSNGNYICLAQSIPPFKLNLIKRFEGHNCSGYKIGCCWSSDGNLLLTGSSDGLLYYYNSNSAKIIYRKKLSNQVLTDVDYHPCLNGIVAVSSWDKHIYILDAKEKNEKIDDIQ